VVVVVVALVHWMEKCAVMTVKRRKRKGFGDFDLLESLGCCENYQESQLTSL
jgi:hypothetical protein